VLARHFSLNQQVIAPLLPIMIAVTLLIIIWQTRSLAARVMVFLTASPELTGAVLFNR